MKKFLSVFLLVSMFFSISTLLTSCFLKHECEFSSEWTVDENFHWRVCKDEKCKNIADKSAHSYGLGEITTKPTQEAEGVKTYSCIVCEKTKTEAVEFTGLTEQEWNEAFENSVFENFAYTEEASVSGNGVTVDTSVDYRFTKFRAWMKLVIGGEKEETTITDIRTVFALRQQLVASIMTFVEYDNFEYDAQTKTYKAKAAIFIASVNTSTDYVALTFEGNRLAKIEYSASIVQNGSTMKVSSVVTLFDYGKVLSVKPDMFNS